MESVRNMTEKELAVILKSLKYLHKTKINIIKYPDILFSAYLN